MADFSEDEKTNAAYKHLYGLLGTSNVDATSGGRQWYEEKIPATHVIFTEDIWAEDTLISGATTQAEARTAATASGSVVEDRSQGEGISLVANGSSWDITTSTIVPEIGYQVTDVHPSATYLRSITNVVDNGGGSYTITLNSNIGVSAGSAVLHSRIFLTEDPTSNGLSYLCRRIVGNTFSPVIKNLIPNAKFGQGYAIRLYQADGTEITTTQGAWIPNWQQGLILFGDGFTPDDEGYTTPLYIEAFRYVGQFGSGGLASIPGNLHETLRHNGSGFESSNALLNDGSDIYVPNTLTISGAIVVPSGVAPTSSLDAGQDGEIRRNGRFLYVHTGGKWLRAPFSSF
jgi:hypothetical protein